MADARPVEERIDNSDFGLALLGFASGSMDALAFLNLRQVSCLAWPWDRGTWWPPRAPLSRLPAF